MDFLATIHLSPGQKEARRLAGLRLLEEGWSQADVSRELGVSDSAVNRWAKAAAEGGAEALKRRPHTGRPTKLTKHERESIPALLAAGAEAHGFENDVWTAERVAALIRNEFDVEYHPGHVWKLLQSLGMKWKKPRRHAHNRDDDAIQRWIRDEWPRLKNGQRSSEQ